MNLNNRSGIYSITNTLNGNVYIGQTTCLRIRKNGHFLLMKNGKGKNPHLQAAYNKYGCEAFTFTPILYCEPFELTRYEQALIDCRKPAYNIQLECVDSSRGIKRSDECRKKLSERFVSDETKHRISESKKGKPSPFKGVPATEEQKRKNRIAHLGKTATDETKHKMSEARMGRPMTEETKRKISEAQTGDKNHWFGHHPTEESKLKMSESHKAFYKAQRELLTGEQYAAQSN